MITAMRDAGLRLRDGILPWTPALALLALGPTVGLAGFVEHGVPLSVEQVAGPVSLRIWLLLIVAVVSSSWTRRRTVASVRGAAMTPTVRHDAGSGVDLGILLGAIATTCALTLFVSLPDLAARSVLHAVELHVPTWQPSRWLILVLLLVLLTRLTERWSARGEQFFGLMALGYWALLLSASVSAIARSPAVLTVLDPRTAWSWCAHRGATAILELAPVSLVLIGLDRWIRAVESEGRARRWRLGLILVLFAVIVAELGQAAVVAGSPAGSAQTLLQAIVQDSPLLGPALSLSVLVLGCRHLLQRATRPLREAAQLGLLPRMGFERAIGLEGESFRLPVLSSPMLLLQLALWFGTNDTAALAAATALPLTGAWVAHALLRLRHERSETMFATPRAMATLSACVALGAPLLAAALFGLRDGAWLALALPLLGVIVARSWQRGREHLLASSHSTTLSLSSFCESIRSHPPRRIQHTAIVLTSRPESVPPVLLANLGFNQVLFARVIILTVDTVDRPRVDDIDRLDFEPVGEGFYRARLRFGVEEETDVPATLERLAPKELAKPIRGAVYLIGHEVVVPPKERWWRVWQYRLFAALVRNAQPAHEHFQIPPNRRIEIGTRWST